MTPSTTQTRTPTNTPVTPTPTKSPSPTPTITPTITPTGYTFQYTLSGIYPAEVEGVSYDIAHNDPILNFLAYPNRVFYYSGDVFTPGPVPYFMRLFDSATSIQLATIWYPSGREGTEFGFSFSNGSQIYIIKFQYAQDIYIP